MNHSAATRSDEAGRTTLVVLLRRLSLELGSAKPVIPPGRTVQLHGQSVEIVVLDGRGFLRFEAPPADRHLVRGLGVVLVGIASDGSLARTDHRTDLEGTVSLGPMKPGRYWIRLRSDVATDNSHSTVAERLAELKARAQETAEAAASLGVCLAVQPSPDEARVELVRTGLDALDDCVAQLRPGAVVRAAWLEDSDFERAAKTELAEQLSSFGTCELNRHSDLQKVPQGDGTVVIRASSMLTLDTGGIFDFLVYARAAAPLDGAQVCLAGRDERGCHVLRHERVAWDPTSGGYELRFRDLRPGRYWFPRRAASWELLATAAHRSSEEVFPQAVSLAADTDSMPGHNLLTLTLEAPEADATLWQDLDEHLRLTVALRGGSDRDTRVHYAIVVPDTGELAAPSLSGDLSLSRERGCIGEVDLGQHSRALIERLARGGLVLQLVELPPDAGDGR